MDHLQKHSQGYDIAVTASNLVSVGGPGLCSLCRHGCASGCHPSPSLIPHPPPPPPPWSNQVVSVEALLLLNKRLRLQAIAAASVDTPPPWEPLGGPGAGGSGSGSGGAGEGGGESTAGDAPTHRDDPDAMSA